MGVLEAGEKLCEELASAEWGPLRERLGLGVLRPRWSKTAGRKYWSQGCRDCDALFGQWPLREVLQEAATTGWDGVRRVGPIRAFGPTPFSGGRPFDGPGRGKARR